MRMSYLLLLVLNGLQLSAQNTNLSTKQNRLEVKYKNVSFTLIKMATGKTMIGHKEANFGNSTPYEASITKAFYIAETEVTQELYQAVMGVNPSYHKGPNLPVEKVSLAEAINFTKKLSQYTGKQFRLPTNHEWEYACKAGADTPYPWADKSPLNYAWHHKNTKTSQAVKTKLPNAFGLYNMNGNVSEWVSPEGPIKPGSVYHTARGGNYNSGTNALMSAHFFERYSFNKTSIIGFRLALENE
jgi:formylglycine-generating enzyme required for sulfatase activity